MRRSNQEFADEVFRRSNLYIQKRKKRNRILAGCMPLVLGIVFMGLSRDALWGVSSADETGLSETSESVEVPNDNGIVSSAEDMEILFFQDEEIVSARLDTGNSAESQFVNCQVTDPELLGRMVSAMESMVLEYDSKYLESDYAWMEDTEKSTGQLRQESEDKVIRRFDITLMDAQGNEREYIFFGRNLYDASTQRIRLLSEEEAGAFQSLLEEILSAYKEAD